MSIFSITFLKYKKSPYLTSMRMSNEEADKVSLRRTKISTLIFSFLVFGKIIYYMPWLLPSFR